MRIGHVEGVPRWLLGLEGAGLAVFGIVAFSTLDQPWWLFAAFILVPDLAMLAYLGGPRLGAVIYNAAHVSLGPVMLAILGWYFASTLMLAIAAIWLVHIGLDRALGFGLKYPTSFQDTHLGRIGRPGPAAT